VGSPSSRRMIELYVELAFYGCTTQGAVAKLSGKYQHSNHFQILLTRRVYRGRSYKGPNTSLLTLRLRLAPSRAASAPTLTPPPSLRINRHRPFRPSCSWIRQCGQATRTSGSVEDAASSECGEDEAHPGVGCVQVAAKGIGRLCSVHLQRGFGPGMVILESNPRESADPAVS